MITPSLKNRFLVIFIFLNLIFASFPALPFSEIKLNCDVIYNESLLDEKQPPYKGSVILNIFEYTGDYSFEIDDSPVFMKIDNKKIADWNKNKITLTDYSNDGKWDIAVVEKYTNGNSKERKFKLDRNIGKLFWSDYSYFKSSTNTVMSKELIGSCKKLDNTKKLF